MSGYGYSEEHQPLTYWRGHPVYAAQFVVIVYCALMVVMAVLGQSAMPIINWLGFSSEKVFSGQVWRLVSYGWCNFPSLNFALDMLMLWWFGGELERTFGRRKYSFLYGGIYLTPVVVLLLIGIFGSTAKFGQPGALALFVAFATYFPGAPVFFTLLAKWAALIFVGIFSLIHLSSRDWINLIVLWSTCGYAHLFIRVQQGTLTLPAVRLWPRRKPHLHVLPALPAKTIFSPAPKPAPADTTMAEVDALLDKISQSSIGSLTAKERAKLESARDDLKKRGAGRN